jgi:hypothetical protein
MSDKEITNPKLQGDVNIHNDEWKKQLDLESAAYKEAGNEFLNGTLINIGMERPCNFLIKHEIVS